MKTTKKQFEQFKKEFIKWQKKFGLNDYRVDFYLDYIDNDAARIYSPHTDNVVSVYLNTTLTINIKESAKHEAIHLLLNNLSKFGYLRFGVTEEALSLAEEKLVVRLMDLIK